MANKTVKDLMVPLDDYAVVPDDATLLEAVIALDKAQQKLPSGRQPHRAVLVTDRTGKIVGKIGQLAFLRGLEPKYNLLGDPGLLSRAGVRQEVITSMMEYYQLFQDDFPDLCMRGRMILVKDVMRRVAEHIGEEASLCEAIHQMVMYQTLSILVTRGEDVIGLLRLSDLYDEISTQMKKALQESE